MGEQKHRHAVVVDGICCQYFYLFIFTIMITYFFQGNEEDSDEMIGMERATPLSSEKDELDQRTGMIGTATAADDEEVLVILRSMKSAVSHLLERKIFERMRVETRSSPKKIIITRSLKSFVIVFNEVTKNK